MEKTRTSRMDPRWNDRQIARKWTRLSRSTEHLWPEITNPVIRRVLTAAYRTLPRDTYYGIVFDEPEYSSLRVIEYQLWLSERLPRSGLAQGLAAGLDHLPDSGEELPQPWRYLAKRFGPRDVAQLTRKLMFNLEWYVDQSRRPRDPWSVFADNLPASLYFLVVLLPTLLLTTGLGRLPLLSICGVGLLMWAVLMLVLSLWGFDADKHRTNCAEFYHYLIREYSDVKYEDPGREYELRIAEKYWLSPIDIVDPTERELARRQTGGLWPQR